MQLRPPIPPDTQGREKAVDRQVPPVLRLATEWRDHAEANPADGPADEQDREDNSAIPADLFGRDGSAWGLQ